MLYPLNYHLSDMSYFILKFKVLNVPHHKLCEQFNRELYDIQQLSLEYQNKPIDHFFLHKFQSFKITTSIVEFYTAPRGMRILSPDVTPKVLNKLYDFSRVDPSVNSTNKLHSSTYPMENIIIQDNIPDLFNISNLNKFIVPNIYEIAGEKRERLGSGSYGKVFKTSKNLAIKKFD